MVPLHDRFPTLAACTEQVLVLGLCLGYVETLFSLNRDNGRSPRRTMFPVFAGILLFEVFLHLLEQLGRRGASVATVLVPQHGVPILNHEPRGRRRRRKLGMCGSCLVVKPGTCRHSRYLVASSKIRGPRGRHSHSINIRRGAPNWLVVHPGSFGLFEARSFLNTRIKSGATRCHAWHPNRRPGNATGRSPANHKTTTEKTTKTSSLGNLVVGIITNDGVGLLLRRRGPG